MCFAELNSNSMKLSITISSKTEEFTQALEYIKKQVEDGFTSGFDGDEDENFQYDIEKES